MQTVVIMTGIMASGKSTIAETYVKQGYKRLNRDTEGGRIADLVPKMVALLKDGYDVILDNTHPTVKSRTDFIREAHRLGAKVISLWVYTPLKQAQINLCRRMIRMGVDIRDCEAIDKFNSPNVFGPHVQYAYQRRFEKPSLGEGFDSLEEFFFVRSPETGHNGKALILDYDGTLRKTITGKFFPTDPRDIQILPGRGEILRKYESMGYKLLGVSNQSGIAKGALTTERAKECFAYTNRMLGVEIDVEFCSHSHDANCYCRKPMCGLGVVLMERYKLDPNECIFVGDLDSDRQFAMNCGFQYKDARSFFPEQ